MDQSLAVILTIVTAATPLLLAAIGELVVERSGVLNLGVEGMMVMGAVAGFAVAFLTGSTLLGAGAAILAGVGMSLLFDFSRSRSSPTKWRRAGAHLFWVSVFPV
jgi:simple sugar transport system permease protein